MTTYTPHPTLLGATLVGLTHWGWGEFPGPCYTWLSRQQEEQPLGDTDEPHRHDYMVLVFSVNLLLLHLVVNFLTEEKGLQGK